MDYLNPFPRYYTYNPCDGQKKDKPNELLSCVGAYTNGANVLPIYSFADLQFWWRAFRLGASQHLGLVMVKLVLSAPCVGNEDNSFRLAFRHGQKALIGLSGLFIVQ